MCPCNGERRDLGFNQNFTQYDPLLSTRSVGVERRPSTHRRSNAGHAARRRASHPRYPRTLGDVRGRSMYNVHGNHPDRYAGPVFHVFQNELEIERIRIPLRL